METNEVNYVGREMRGFRFDAEPYKFIELMEEYVGRIGVIEGSFTNKYFWVQFPNGVKWLYPKAEALSHLVEEPPQTKEEKPAEQKPEWSLDTDGKTILKNGCIAFGLSMEEIIKALNCQSHLSAKDARIAELEKEVELLKSKISSYGNIEE